VGAIGKAQSAKSAPATNHAIEMHRRLSIEMQLALALAVPLGLTGDLHPASAQESRPQPQRQARQRSDIRSINVLDHGARGDGKSHPLSEDFADQAAIDAQYGPGKYSLDDEADFVGLSESLATARQSPNEALPEGAYGLMPIYIPKGVYKINRTMNVRGAYGLTISGAGRDATRLSFNSASDLFYVDDAINIVFKGLTVESTPAATATAFHFNDIPEGAGPTFKFSFDSVSFNGFHTGVRTTGSMMTDSVVYKFCRFSNCVIGLHLQNPQSLIHNFFGCDFEAHADDAFYAPYKASGTVFIKAEAGGSVNMFGGSVMLGGTTLVLAPDAKLQDAINLGNGMYNFYGVRWEQMKTPGQAAEAGPLLFDKHGTSATRARINFHDCILYQQDATHGRDIGVLRNGMNVSIANSHCNYGKIQLFIDENTPEQWGSLTIENSEFIGCYELRAAPMKGMPNVHHHVRYTNGAAHAADNSYVQGTAKVDQMDFDILPAPTVSARAKRIVYREAKGTLPDGGRIILQTPTRATLTTVGVVKTSAERAIYVVTDMSGRVKFGRLRTGPGAKKRFLENIEVENDQSAWDGSIVITIEDAETGGTGYIFCEYY